jgi:hypothetical protein
MGKAGRIHLPSPSYLDAFKASLPHPEGIAITGHNHGMLVELPDNSEAFPPVRPMLHRSKVEYLATLCALNRYFPMQGDQRRPGLSANDWAQQRID